MPSRNDPCPCGSGKKYKKCCLNNPKPETVIANVPLAQKDVAAIWVDSNRRKVIVGHRDILRRQLTIHEPRIAKSFDRICATHLDEFGPLISEIGIRIAQGLSISKDANDSLVNTCGTVLLTVLSTLNSAVTVMRAGFRLQPGILYRTCVEDLCVILHLLQKPSDLEAVKAGTFHAPKSVSAAKNILPFLGNFYGLLTKHYSHLSPIHQIVTVNGEYSEIDEALRINLAGYRMCLWVLLVTTELAFFPYNNTSQWWTRVGNGEFGFDPKADARTWMFEFLFRDLTPAERDELSGASG